MSIIKGNVICCDDCGLIGARVDGPPKGWVEVRVWLRLRHLCPECKQKRVHKWRYHNGVS